jgi:hypothetical protein
MGRPGILSICAIACAAMVASCASREVQPGSTVRLTVATSHLVYPSTDAPFAPRVGPPTSPEPVVGAQCELWNDLGRWTVVTPGTAEIPNSVANLNIRCTAPGFRPAHGWLACISEGQRGLAFLGAGVSTGALMYGLAWGHGGDPTAAGVVLIGVAAVSSIYGISKATGPDARECHYAFKRDPRIDIVMELW